jgi:hypothetical protein
MDRLAYDLEPGSLQTIRRFGPNPVRRLRRYNQFVGKLAELLGAIAFTLQSGSCSQVMLVGGEDATANSGWRMWHVEARLSARAMGRQDAA